MMPLKVLAMAAISDRIGLAYLVGGRLKDWTASENAAASPVAAAGYTQEMINFYRPNVVVTEKLTDECLKGKSTQHLIRAMARTADQNYVLDVAIEHTHPYPSKYEEAEALAKAYPAIAAWLPKKRRFFDNQPRNMVLFEALSLGHSIAPGPADKLAAAM